MLKGRAILSGHSSGILNKLFEVIAPLGQHPVLLMDGGHLLIINLQFLLKPLIFSFLIGHLAFDMKITFALLREFIFQSIFIFQRGF